MKFGYFDDEKREYVITKPDTPAPWVNYLGSPEYGAIISNQAGGYSFAKSGASGRILRYVFNQFDQPGRYLYIRDNQSKDFWSASWQPVGKDLASYQSECRHGLSYTKMLADYDQIHSEATYYVPLDQTYEIWNLTLTNRSKLKRELTVTGYAEFTNSNNYEMDQVNLQYSQFITQTEFHENRILQKIHANLDAIEEGRYIDEKTVIQRFFGLTGARVDSYCGSKESFLGAYHGYHNPIGVTEGNLKNQLHYNGNGCGALSTILSLEPGEEISISFILGMHTDTEAGCILSKYDNPKSMLLKELEELETYWNQKLSRFQVQTPSEEFNTMINTWNAYNCFMTVIWSRAASFTYCGLRNGYGYRDTVQDIQGVIHLAPEMALEKIRFMLSAQVHHGAGLPLVKFNHRPGFENTPEDASYGLETGHPSYRADDALWLFPTVYKYIAETGNTDFLEEIIPFADKEEATVYEHLQRAIEFSMNHLGEHGMPVGLHADWNDCLRLGEKGESTFVAFQLYYAMTIIKEMAEYKGDLKYRDTIDFQQAKLGKILQTICWDRDRFIRGYTDEGVIIGKRSDKEANLWLNPQSWSVISGCASLDQSEMALQKVYEELNTEYGTMLMYPPYHKDAFDGALAVIYNPGTKENASIFSQTQGWAILAEALHGHGNRAFTYFMEHAPAAQNNQAEVRKLEPYCYGQFTEGKDSPMFGRSQVHWLTGTASTMMVGCVEGILGMRPDFKGLRLEPAIPKEWKELKITKYFRGKELRITILNPEGKETGCSKITLNGTCLKEPYFLNEELKQVNEIQYML